MDKMVRSYLDYENITILIWPESSRVLEVVYSTPGDVKTLSSSQLTLRGKIVKNVSEYYMVAESNSITSPNCPPISRRTFSFFALMGTSYSLIQNGVQENFNDEDCTSLDILFGTKKKRIDRLPLSMFANKV